ncbi:MAG: DUF4388 domain-containing protein [Deltaproteobacteria bacterium]|nr:DUF4388 domain-containing protein [Deltaproteobacteria bacterium]
MLSIDFNALQHGPIEGQFQQVMLPALLVRVARMQRTGRLTLTYNNNERSICFAEGVPTSAGSRALSEHLGQRLRKLDLISSEQLDQVDQLMCNEPLQFGEAMRKLGIIREDELRRLLRTHHNWILTQALSVKEATVSYSPYAWVPTDPSGIAFLQTIEDGIRGFGLSMVKDLLAAANNWLFILNTADIELANKLGATKHTVESLERLQGMPRLAEQIFDACNDNANDVTGLTLLVCGFFRAVAKKPTASKQPLSLVDNQISDLLVPADNSVVTGLVKDQQKKATLPSSKEMFDSKSFFSRNSPTTQRLIIIFVFIVIGLALGLIGGVFFMSGPKKASKEAKIENVSIPPEPDLVTKPPEKPLGNE